MVEQAAKPLARPVKVMFVLFDISDEKLNPAIEIELRNGAAIFFNKFI